MALEWAQQVQAQAPQVLQVLQEVWPERQRPKALHFFTSESNTHEKS
jgi:hypothetical protein